MLAPRAKAGDPLLGRTLAGSYLVLEAIGAGGMGRVYRAEQVSLNKTVAVKAIHPHLASDESAAGRFYTEARACSRINHPNAVSVLDFGRTEEGLLYIVMEYLRGRDLARVVWERGRLSTRESVHIITQVLAALSEAHHHQVVHRDVKPENIFVEPMRTGEEFVKVLDFGLARLLDGPGNRMTNPGLVCGTPEFMAPEQCQGETVGPQSDQYAAAVVLYHCLTGRLPFEADAPAQVLLKQVVEPAPDPRKFAPSVPESMVKVLRRALEKKPEARYPSVVDFASALRLALEEAEGPTPRVKSGILCVSCNEPITPGVKFCSNCGTPFGKTPARSDVRTPTPTPHVTDPRIGERLTAPPFVGRQTERAKLNEAWVRAREGGFEFVRVIGEEGSGRHRLVSDLVATAKADGARVVTVRPDPTWADVPYEPVRRAVRELLGIAGAVDPCDWLESVTDAGRGGADPLVRAGFHEIFRSQGAAGLEPAARNDAAARAVRFALAGVGSHRGPVLFVVSRADRVDAATRRVLTSVCATPVPGPVMALVLQTPRYVSPVASTLELRLGGFDPREVQEFLRAVAMTDIELPEGPLSPLHLLQLLHWHREGGGPAPRQLVDLVSARIARVSPSARRILQGLAIVGETSLDLLDSVVEARCDDATLDWLLRNGWIHRDAQDLHERLRIAHSMLREVIRSETPAAVAEALHRAALRVAETLELPMEVRAMHADLGGDVFRALVLYDPVGDAATLRGDYDSAARVLRRGLELARRELSRGDLNEPDSAVVIFALKLSEALFKTGHLVEAEGVLREGIGVAPRGGAEALRLQAQLGRILLARGRVDDARRTLDLALQQGLRQNLRAVAVDLYVRRAELSTHVQQHEEAVEFLGLASAMLRERSLKGERAIGRRKLAEVLLKLASAQRLAGQSSKETLEQLAGLQAELDWPLGRALYESEVAEEAEAQSEPRRALSAWRRALAEARSAGDGARVERIQSQIERLGHAATPAMLGRARPA